MFLCRFNEILRFLPLGRKNSREAFDRTRHAAAGINSSIDGLRLCLCGNAIKKTINPSARCRMFGLRLAVGVDRQRHLV